MAIIRWSPYRSLININSEAGNLFDDFFSPVCRRSEAEANAVSWVPNVDLTENKEAYTLRADLPGVSKEDVKVTFAEGVLTIAGEKKSEKEIKNENFHRSERNYGAFSRSFRLPDPVHEEKIQAEYRDGVLTLTLPKSEGVKPREIEIK
ncbi:MAG: Hsp20/alpha crystallin family protein [Candidatus Firestonebacteria bacterium]|nr:Hsp20/alpha crystallin family protein [Candidatus Firestonebacteria bacterium]